MDNNTADPITTEELHGKKVRPFGLRDKLGYMFGDFGNDFFFMLTTAFLMVFYTDVFGLSGAAVGTLFFVARIWDAVADVVWGRFIDSRKTTKNGKFKPWIFRMSFPLVISGILMFVTIPGMSEGFYLAYAYVTYISWGTLYSTVNIPYGSMASVITADPVERTSLSTFRTAGAMRANLIINSVGPLLIFVDNKVDPNRMVMTAILFGILALSCYMACVKLSTERIIVPERTLEQKKGGFKKTVKGLGRNWPLLAILTGTLVFLVSMMLVASVNVYVFKDYFNNAAALSIVGIIQTGTTFLAIPIVTPIVKRFGKKEMASVGLFLASVSYLTLYFLPNVQLIGFYIGTAFGMFGMALFNVVVWAFVTDVIDYHELITGLREDGTVYSIYSFARKLGQAVAGGVGGFAIAYVGYKSGRTVQTQETLDGIYTLATLVPGLLYLTVALILIFWYPLTKTRLAQMTEDLAQFRELRAKQNHPANRNN